MAILTSCTMAKRFHYKTTSVTWICQNFRRSTNYIRSTLPSSMHIGRRAIRQEAGCPCLGAPGRRAAESNRRETGLPARNGIGGSGGRINKERCFMIGRSLQLQVAAWPQLHYIHLNLPLHTLSPCLSRELIQACEGKKKNNNG